MKGEFIAGMTNKQIFDEFIVEHLDNARRIALVYIKNTEDAEDVVSESVVKALMNIHKLREPQFMPRWFNRIVVRTAIDYWRKQSKSVGQGAEIPLPHIDEFSRIEFEDLLDILAPNDKKILSLRFGDNRTINEISDILGMNENTVKTRLYRSLKKLKLEITKDDHGLTLKEDKKIVKTVTMSVVATLISLIALFNLSPSLSVAAYDVPILGDLIRVITFNRFDYKEKGYSAEILVPQIQGLLDPELETRLNAEFAGYADELIRSFEASIPKIKEIGVEEFEVHDPDYDAPVIEQAKMSVKADYMVKTNNERLLSLNAYLYSDVGNYETHKFYTIDKQKGILVTLSGLFEANADYITPISEYLTAEMERINREEDGVFTFTDVPNQFGNFCEIKPDNNFYINDDSKLVICFDKYEVAAGFIGSPEFVIPTEVIKVIVSTNLLE